MTQANDYQVGGDHYKSTYIHWDFAVNVGLNYLEGNATKYLCRPGKGKTLEDYQKANHYTVKLMENSSLMISRRILFPQRFLITETNRFLTANEIKGEIARAFRLIVLWESRDDLQQSIHIVKRQIDLLGMSIEPPTAKPVPLEDSNKYADRSY